MSESETTAAGASEAPAKPRKILVYIGVKEGTGEKLFNAYIEVSEAQLKSGALPESYQLALYDKRAKSQSRHMAGSEGMAYSVEYEAAEPGSIYPGSAKYVGRWPDRQQVVTWTAANDAAEADRDSRKSRREETRFNAVRDDLERVRAAYKALPAPHRLFFLAQVVDYLNRGS